MCGRNTVITKSSQRSKCFGLNFKQFTPVAIRGHTSQTFILLSRIGVWTGSSHPSGNPQYQNIHENTQSTIHQRNVVNTNRCL